MKDNGDNAGEGNEDRKITDGVKSNVKKLVSQHSNLGNPCYATVPSRYTLCLLAARSNPQQK